ncbi:hypothetical protein TraAM80_05249 [Trypanosoma rangeli]|uniref:Uncharacterized protein n=1 Tax=Trypanosoma rangeli TaxID=5698 RepID=A0A3R7NCK6_TRYRA|nr:uncharacterized protein TraAM80_05249 [Trypanosoma rangeli]RNF04372.1 hypothetical protein TraAM80_05249 [Trypanosoma rangeli]|eukprot:RNF04372.1 hypothetical protein TraAM80_05249 [Trypanosoma rangeli]
MGSPVVTKAAAAAAAAPWRGSAQTTPVTSPQRQHGSGGSVPRQQSRWPPPQQGVRDAAGLPSPALEAHGRGKGLLLFPSTAATPRRLSTTMKPRPETTTTVVAAAPSSVSTALAHSFSSSAQHVLPLHDQPAFRTDLVHRTVFVFGLHTVEECRALLQLLQENCGPIAGAFRTADLTCQHDTAFSTSSSWGAGIVGGGCVVICVAFYRAESACMARRLDNTAHVYQKRFLVESAVRFQHLSSLHESMSVSAAAAMLAMPGTPQHERLWQLLFSPTIGAATIDWQAAAAAVGRGEALLLKSTPPPAGLGGGGAEENATTNMGFLIHRDHESNGRYHTHLGFRPLATVGRDSAGGGVLAGGGEPARKFDFAMDLTGTSASTAPATTAASTMPTSKAATAAAYPTGFATDALGRSNTLQQQYYITRYESSDVPLFSFAARLFSLVLSHITNRVSGASSGGGGLYGEAYLPAPLRQRVERVDGRYYDTASATAASTTSAPVAGDRGVGGAGRDVGAHNPSFALGEQTTGTAYIPRMRSIGDYVIATLPFATQLLTPLFRAGGDDAPPDNGHSTEGSRGGLGSVNDATSGGGVGNFGSDPTGPVEGPSDGGVGFYRGHPPHTTAFASRRRKRPRDLTGLGDGETGEALAADNMLRGMGEGFVSLQPDTLAALFPATAATAAAAVGISDVGVTSTASYCKRDVAGASGVSLASASPSSTSPTPPGATIDAAASNDAVRAYLTESIRLRSLPSRDAGSVPVSAFAATPAAAATAPPGALRTTRPPPPPTSVWQGLTSPLEWGRWLRHARNFYDRFC